MPSPKVSLSPPSPPPLSPPQPPALPGLRTRHGLAIPGTVAVSSKASKSFFPFRYDPDTRARVTRHRALAGSARRVSHGFGGHAAGCGVLPRRRPGARLGDWQWRSPRAAWFFSPSCTLPLGSGLDGAPSPPSPPPACRRRPRIGGHVARRWRERGGSFGNSSWAPNC